MVTTWTVHPADAGVTTVRVRTTWNGAGGDRRASSSARSRRKGLRRVYDEMLDRLDASVATG